MIQTVFNNNKVTLLQGDCLEYMRALPYKKFDIAIVDPPYGSGKNWRKSVKSKFFKHKNNFNDAIPPAEYFNELMRVSKHQIIFGCNYFWQYLPPTNNLIFWDKGRCPKKTFQSAGELAWTSITKYPLIKIELTWNGFIACEKVTRIHPHQKPVKLYKWLLDNFAEPGQLILDTHLGSGSSAIACLEHGFSMVGIEKDRTYLKSTIERINERFFNNNQRDTL